MFHDIIINLLTIQSKEQARVIPNRFKMQTDGQGNGQVGS